MANTTMRPLIIINDAPYGSEKPYNALRLARALTDHTDEPVHVFLFGNAVGCAVAGQDTPDGYYKLDRMLRSVARKGGVIGCCSECMNARGINDEQLIDEAHRSSMDELTKWTASADRVLTF